MTCKLQTTIYAGVLTILLFCPLSVHAYKEPTHMEMSKAAASSSDLSKIEKLNGIGLVLSMEDDKQQFPDSDGNLKSIINLIRQGANFEDTDSRALNHFFNPLNNQPLTMLGFSIFNATSPDWAVEDKGDITSNIGGAQNFSYKDARQSFYNALTLPTKTDRDKNFGLTFQTLGQIIHHIQDMAQPQHVRNDAHLDKHSMEIFGLQLNPLYNPSFYENYTNDNLGKLPPCLVYTPPSTRPATPICSPPPAPSGTPLRAAAWASPNSPTETLSLPAPTSTPPTTPAQACPRLLLTMKMPTPCCNRRESPHPRNVRPPRLVSR